MKYLKIFTLIILTLTSTAFKAGERVLFIGDSLTCYANGWQDQVCSAKGYSRVNISKGGKRTGWMLSTLVSHLEKDHNYDKVFIYGGCNDAFSYVDLDGAVDNLQQMVLACRFYGIDPYVIVGYNPEKVMIKTPYPEKVTKFHRDRYVLLQKKMLSLTDCTIIPMDTTVTSLESGDGIHLGAKGHRKFSSWVLLHLK